jgi:hypothetical protein
MIIFSVIFIFIDKFSAMYITFVIVSINIVFTNIFILILSSTCNIDILFVMLNLLTVVYLSDLGNNSHYTDSINLVNRIINKGSALLPFVVKVYT